jgi:hypothetical protein
MKKGRQDRQLGGNQLSIAVAAGGGGHEGSLRDVRVGRGRRGRRGAGGGSASHKRSLKKSTKSGPRWKKERRGTAVRGVRVAAGPWNAKDRDSRGAGGASKMDDGSQVRENVDART